MNQKIKDEARERIIKRLMFSTLLSRDGASKEANIILAIEGETDEVCWACDKGRWATDKRRKCENCDGTGTIKKKWHIKVEVEDGS